MKKNINLFYVFVLLSCIAGCATTQGAPQIPQQSSAIIPAPKDKVWPLLVSEVAMQYPVQVIEKESGLIATQFVQMPVGFNNMGMERYIFPPKNFLATWNGLRMNMQIMAIESDSGITTVRINAHYEAFENNVSKTWIVAQSNGSLENQILRKVMQKLK